MNMKIFNILTNLICETLQSDRDTNIYWFSTNKCNVFSNKIHFNERIKQRTLNLTNQILTEKVKRTLQEISKQGYLDNVIKEQTILVYFKLTDLCYVLAINPSTSHFTCENEM